MEKKTKLTISGTAKKSFKNIEIAKTQNKNSVVIDKQSNKFLNRSGSSRPGSFKPKLDRHLIEVLLKNQLLHLNHPQ
jgi:translation initiation factor IF-2